MWWLICDRFLKQGAGTRHLLEVSKRQEIRTQRRTRKPALPTQREWAGKRGSCMHAEVRGWQRFRNLHPPKALEPKSDWGAHEFADENLVERHAGSASACTCLSAGTRVYSHDLRCSSQPFVHPVPASRYLANQIKSASGPCSRLLVCRSRAT